MKAICLTAFNRPEMLNQTLAAIHRNQMDGWQIFIGSDHQRVDHVPSMHSWRNGFRMGCPLNSFNVCFKAIQEGAEACLFMDDDVLLSPDALRMCNWYLNRELGTNDAGIALCRKDGNDPSKPESISASETWMGHLGQGWCFTRQMWFDFVLRHWWAYHPDMKEHDTYDWALCFFALKLCKTIVRPRFARARHAGEVGYHGKGIGTFPDVICQLSECNYKVE